MISQVEVDVLQEDIKNGRRESYLNCPVALAINRALGCTGGYKFLGKEEHEAMVITIADVEKWGPFGFSTKLQDRVGVLDGEVAMDSPGGWKEIATLSKDMEEKILQFDKGAGMKPFRFVMEVTENGEILIPLMKSLRPAH